MGDSLDGMFGGDESGAQRKENSDNRGYFDDKANEGRDDALQLFPASDENRNMGYQAALDLLKISMPEQSRQFRRGNVEAQNLMKASMPQYQNAILGNRIDYRKLQPTLLSDNTTYRDQNVPNFIQTPDLPLRRQPNYRSGDLLFNPEAIRKEDEEIFRKFRPRTDEEQAMMDLVTGPVSPITDDMTLEERLANLPRSTSLMGDR